MRKIISVVAWLTLFGDACLLSGIIHSRFFDPTIGWASINFGGVKITSQTPEGASFITFIMIWTAILAIGYLYLNRRIRKLQGKKSIHSLRQTGRVNAPVENL